MARSGTRRPAGGWRPPGATDWPEWPRRRSARWARAGPAAAAGIRPGDTILKIGTRRVRTPRDAIAALAVIRDLGAPVDIALLRGGQQRVVALSFDAAPRAADAPDKPEGMADCPHPAPVCRIRQAVFPVSQLRSGRQRNTDRTRVPGHQPACRGRPAGCGRAHARRAEGREGGPLGLSRRPGAAGGAGPACGRVRSGPRRGSQGRWRHLRSRRRCSPEGGARFRPRRADCRAAEGAELGPGSTFARTCSPASAAARWWTSEAHWWGLPWAAARDVSRRCPWEAFARCWHCARTRQPPT